MPPIDIKLLMRKKDELLGDRQKILDRIVAEGRGYTDEENVDAARLQNRIDRYDAQIREAKDIENQRAGIPPGQPKPGMPTGDPAAGQAAGGGAYSRENKPHLVDARSGEEIRCFLPTEDWTAGKEYRSVDGVQPGELRLSNIVKGVLSGDWEGRELERRTMVEEVGYLGGFTIPDFMAAQILQDARNALRIGTAGALTVAMPGPTLTLAKVSKEPSASWIPESGHGTFDDLNFQYAELKARKLVSLAKLSEELIMDSSNIEMLLRECMSHAIAAEIDRSALLGGGVGEPLGLLNTPGIGSTDLSSVAYKIDDFINVIFDLMSLNVEQPRISLICNAAVLKVISKLRADGATGVYLESGAPEAWKKLLKLATSQVPVDSTTNTTNAFLGDFRNLWIGMRDNLTVLISRDASDNVGGSAFTQSEVWFRIESRLDILAVRPNHFHILKDGGVS